MLFWNPMIELYNNRLAVNWPVWFFPLCFSKICNDKVGMMTSKCQDSNFQLDLPKERMLNPKTKFYFTDCYKDHERQAKSSAVLRYSAAFGVAPARDAAQNS